MTKTEPDVGSPAQARRRARTALLVVAWIAGIGVAVALLFAAASWLLPSEEVEGALLGPVGFVIAFIVGTISFFSPCVLPLLPGYLSFVSGLSGEELEGSGGRRRMLGGVALFVLGFAAVFTALGASAGLVGSFLYDHFRVFNYVAGSIIVVLGLLYVVPGLLRFAEVERRPFMARVRPGLAGAFPLGLAFGFGWTPCVGPGLGVILTLGTREASVGRAALLLFFFSLGFGVWFVLAAFGMRRAAAASAWIRRRAGVLQVAGGILMVAIGVLLITGMWETLLTPLRRLINTFAPPV